jgi:hypothetical protein
MLELLLSENPTQLRKAALGIGAYALFT